MNKKDFKLWRKFRLTDGQTLQPKEFELICELHAKYFNHAYYEICSCRPKELKRWIADIDRLYNK